MRLVSVLLWLVASIAGAVFGGQIFDRASSVDELGPGAESKRAEALLAQWKPEGPVILAVIKDVDPYDPALVASVTEVARALSGMAKVDSLYTSPGGAIGRDNRSTLVRAELTDLSKQDDVVAGLRRIAAPTVLVGGESLARQEFAERAIRDATIGESIAIGVLALVLVFILRRQAWIPLVAALATVTVTLLALLALSALTTVSEFALNVVTLLGLGLAVDYSLLIIWRYREDGGTRHAKRAVLVSGAAVACALLGLMVFAEPLLAAMAMGGLAAVVVATAVALTLVPALLPSRHRVAPMPEPGSAPRLGREPGAVWERVVRFAVARPRQRALQSAGLLVLLALPFGFAQLHNSDARSLPRDSESRQVQEAWLNDFLQRPEPVTVVMDTDSGSESMRDYLNALNTLDGADRLELRLEIPQGKTVIDLTPEKAEGAGALVRAVRAVPSPVPALVGGPAAEVVDYQDAVLRRLPLVLGMLLVAMMGLLFALTGSLLVPVKALLLNVLSLGAALGSLTMLFGDLDLTTPVLLFVFIFGLSMDYEVFLIARITEEFRRTGDNVGAIVAGLTRTGPVITAAALCLIVVFLGFLLGDLSPVREIGAGMVIAIVIDVTIVRGILLPATMALLGRWNWWPYRQRSDVGLPQRVNAT